MVYYGWVAEGVAPDSVYAVLRRALMRMPEEHPYRGPAEYREDLYIYTNTWSKNIGQFSGEENITRDGTLVYKANYIGGWVDQRQGI